MTLYNIISFIILQTKSDNSFLIFFYLLLIQFLSFLVNLFLFYISNIFQICFYYFFTFLLLFSVICCIFNYINISYFLSFYTSYICVTLFRLNYIIFNFIHLIINFYTFELLKRRIFINTKLIYNIFIYK